MILTRDDLAKLLDLTPVPCPVCSSQMTWHLCTSDLGLVHHKCPKKHGTWVQEITNALADPNEGE